MLIVFAARFVLVSIGYLALESYLDNDPKTTSMNAGLCAILAIEIDRQVIGASDDEAAIGSVLAIVLANYVMTRRRQNRNPVLQS